jgi:hypothetical protein
VCSVFGLQNNLREYLYFCTGKASTFVPVKQVICMYVCMYVCMCVCVCVCVCVCIYIYIYIYIYVCVCVCIYEITVARYRARQSLNRALTEP